MVTKISNQNVHFVAHENWRFQPWYRKIKELLYNKTIGDKLHSIYFQMRMGNGWAENAYLSRQPYFRKMPRLLVYETGIHFIDTFRYLAGEVESVFANLKRLNPAISGEDSGHVMFNFENGANAMWDANRFNESKSKNARYTFGEMLIDGNAGGIRLYNNRSITLQNLGEVEAEVDYIHEDKNFAGDCVYFLQKHFVDCFINDLPFENSGQAYIKNLEIQEAVYPSSKENKVIQISN
jgi:predicted dehydrogenase